MRLDTTERRIMEARGSRHTLIIRKVQASDFANYTCMADNLMGKNRQKLELSGEYSCCSFFHTLQLSGLGFHCTVAKKI
jgi:hypothetical protein